ncbi:MAG: LysR family transcriptional regulator [Candidatus Binatia bacterium]
MNFDQLVTFRTVSNVKSFRRAAQTLHLTQPAVSKQIHALELELGEPLFERGRTARLTSAGEMLLKHVDLISQTLQVAREEIADLKELRRGHLSIGASHMITIHVLPQLLETYRERYPRVSLSIDSGWASEIVGRVMARDLDLSLVSLLSPRPDDCVFRAISTTHSRAFRPPIPL